MTYYIMISKIRENDRKMSRGNEDNYFFIIHTGPSY